MAVKWSTLGTPHGEFVLDIDDLEQPRSGPSLGFRGRIPMTMTPTAVSPERCVVTSPKLCGRPLNVSAAHR